jgi:hypothetical protein
MADTLPPGTLTVEEVQYRLEELRATLPRPVPDTPYAREVRDEIARCMFLALHPADIIDANFACQIILLNAHADDCLRIARETAHDPKCARSARAQARSMKRLMRGTLADLHARQLTRAEAQAGQPQRAPISALLQPRPVPPPNPPATSDADAKAQRAARIRELDLHVVATPDTRH